MPSGADAAGRYSRTNVLRLIRVPLTDGQYDTLASFVFNVGARGLQRSTLRRKINRLGHAAVPAQFVKWIWAGGRKLKGLVRRTDAEAALYANHQPCFVAA